MDVSWPYSILRKRMFISMNHLHCTRGRPFLTVPRKAIIKPVTVGKTMTRKLKGIIREFLTHLHGASTSVSSAMKYILSIAWKINL